jgi:hypothetical protein
VTVTALREGPAEAEGPEAAGPVDVLCVARGAWDAVKAARDTRVLAHWMRGYRSMGLSIAMASVRWYGVVILGVRVWEWGSWDGALRDGGRDASVTSARKLRVGQDS